jgi:hypothetical protein
VSDDEDAILESDSVSIKLDRPGCRADSECASSGGCLGVPRPKEDARDRWYTRIKSKSKRQMKMRKWNRIERQRTRIPSQPYQSSTRKRAEQEETGG